MSVAEGSEPSGHTALPSVQAQDGDLPILGIAFEKSTVAMLVIDSAHLVRRGNTMANTMFGRAPVIGRPILDLFCQLAAPVLDIANLEKRDGKPEGADSWATILSDSGERHPVVMRWHAVAGESGRRYHLVQLWDITPTFWHFAADLPPQLSAHLFDRDLRCVGVFGRDTGSGRYDNGSLLGRAWTDYPPSNALAKMEKYYRAALAGQPSSFEYSSGIDAAIYRVSVRPVITIPGEILGILAFVENVTTDRVRHNLLEQVHQLSRLGSCSYSIADGWVFTKEILDLVGLDHPQEALAVIDLLVVPEDRDQARADYRRTLRSGGRSTVQYRLMHGRTGELRHMAGAIDAVVDAGGSLLRAILTLADVTEAVEAEMAKATAAQERTMLMRRISDALTMPTDDSTQLMQTIADVTTAALGDCTLLRVLTPDGLSVETEFVSIGHAATGIATEVAEWLVDPLRSAGDLAVGKSAVSRKNDLRSSIGNDDWSVDFQEQMNYPIHPKIRHFISAPIRHDGIPLGFLRVFRFDRGTPYQPGDDDVVQVLADRIGAAIAQRRVRELMEQQQTQARAVADRLNELTIEQRELLEQLAGVEERERTLLAMTIHDGPMQTIVAVMMRMEEYTVLGAAVDATEVAALVDTLETSVQRLRTLIIALTPPDLDGGLRTALSMLAEGIFTGTATQISTAGPVHVSLTPLRKGNTHRILREALVNVRKHAQAKHVVIELEQTDAVVVARITDDGVGSSHFDAGPGHLGMVTMRARARAEGGWLKVTSRPGSGTTLTLSVPINASVDLLGDPADPGPAVRPQEPDRRDQHGNRSA